MEMARKTIQAESEAIANLSDLLTDDFARAVRHILDAPGRIVISGIGKSAIIVISG